MTAVVCLFVAGGIGAALIISGSNTTASRRNVSTKGSTTVAPSSTSAASIPTTQPSPGAAGLTAVNGRTLVIDPGHNGRNAQHANEINHPVDIGTQTRACDTVGASTNDGYTEAEYNLDVSLRLADLLRQAGANVVLTHTDNSGWGPCINQRAAIGNDAHADVGVSIHADGGPPDGRGFHVIYPPSIPGLTDGIAANSKRLALDVRAAYQAGSGVPFATYIGNGDGLSERTDLGGLNLSKVPKVFIETGNMRNDTDAALLKGDGFRQQAATAIAGGLAVYLAGQ
ncbi:MAG: N-acetylmuramoyl-L-alanine amidase [Actinomycetota bacterium]|nr:N-acetylmuramoyl-L-alanine amidase [Actinomycetota bacterium]